MIPLYINYHFALFPQERLSCRYRLVLTSKAAAKGTALRFEKQLAQSIRTLYNALIQSRTGVAVTGTVHGSPPIGNSQLEGLLQL